MKYFVIALCLMFARAEHQHKKKTVLRVGRLNEIADHVNNHPQSTWQASKFDTLDQGQMVNAKFRVGVLEGSAPKDAYPLFDVEANQCVDNGLPKEFDARKHWPQCSSVIGHIYDQGNCGSCWAVASASVFTDRVCIATNGKKKALFSSQQIVSCCHKCGGSGDGCNGGRPIRAFAYIKHTGLVTGGDYNSKQGCQPYLMSHCSHHVNGSYGSCDSQATIKTPKCKLHCYNFKHDKTFKQDRIKASKYYTISPCAAQNEIYRNGPILAVFTVFEDFITYKSGVYRHLAGEQTGRHAVKIIGWGEEKGTPYWLAANSWNSEWGDKGLFKIIRGDDEAWIENYFSAISPQV